jgi:acylphosphatase
MVQGVGYRYYTLRCAKQYFLTGWVRNLATAQVEILAEGEKGLLTDFIKELRVGPRSAEVNEVTVTWHTATSEFSNFTIE